jgi:hypothetical protein
MISSKLTLQALMRNDLTGQADEHGLKRKFVSPSARKDT